MCKLNPLQYFDKYITKINYELEKELESYSWSQFYEPLKYACSDGKRIRPLMLILAAESIGNFNDDVYLAAIAVELLHTESIIHDDIIDCERIRRNKIPFYLKYGYNFSILTADFVLGMILNIVSRMNNTRAAKELSKAALKMSEGELHEIKLQNNSIVTIDEYIKMLEYKTASLFEVSMSMGAILGGGNEFEIETLTKFGKHMGIAYQIHDDINDWRKEHKTFNLLLESSNLSKHELLKEMHQLYTKHITYAKQSLQFIKNKTNLEKLITLTNDQFKLEQYDEHE